MKPVEEIPHLVLLSPLEPGTDEQPSLVAFGIATFVAVLFIFIFALPYFTMTLDQFGIYRPRHDWLLAHVAGGTVALLIGPMQLWLGFNRSSKVLHGILGVGYVLSVAVGSAAAFYLAAHTDFGWVFGMGMAGLGIAWTITTALAVAAICRRLIQQHREWMIRSYIVTFAFVIFRVLIKLFDVTHSGTLIEQFAAASWLCWSIPLLITESILQGRKIFR